MDKHIIFPTHTPVDRLGGDSEIEEPVPMDKDVFKKVSARLLKKLRPLLSAP